MKKLVSVIITTKNEGKNIRRLLKSIKSQTYKSIEVIVVDFGSSDNTKRIARKFTDKVFNAGRERSAQRNYGAQKSHGAYFLFLDADMELTSRVVEDCVRVAAKSSLGVLVIPETTVGNGLIPRIRRFEREMYMGNSEIEVARFFKRDIFFEFGGYDLDLTGPEDYDLPYRVSKKYRIGRAKEYILHHEEGLTLGRLLKKKYYYANKGASYAKKHPELIAKQGTILFRRVYIKNWRKFLLNPFIGTAFVVVRILETIWAVTGYINAVGFIDFVKTMPAVFKKPVIDKLK